MHRTISRLKCDCFNTLIHLSLAFRMLQKSPNYFSALYPSWLKYNRDSSTMLLINKSILEIIFFLMEKFGHLSWDKKTKKQNVAKVPKYTTCIA